MDLLSPMTNKLIQIILPIYNEEDNLPRLFENLILVRKELSLNLRIILINDGSFDKTDSIIQNFYNARFMTYYKFDKNMGYSSALKKGIHLCDTEGFILLFDSDNQFDIKEINKLLEYTSDYSVIVGRRSPRADRLSRVLLGNIWSLIGKVFFGTRLVDLNCGFKLLRADILKMIDIHSTGPGINLEIFSDKAIKNLLIKEVKVSHFYRVSGLATGSSLKTLKNSFSDLFKVTCKLIFSKK